MRRTKVNEVSMEAISRTLANELAPEITDELYRFGTFTVSENGQRVSSLNTKLSTILGFSVATLAFLLVKDAGIRGLDIIWKIVRLVTIITSFLAVVAAGFGLKSRMEPTPSEQDWFAETEFSDPGRLKKFHILSLLQLDQNRTRQRVRKARCLRIAEWSLTVTATMILVNLLRSGFWW